MVNGNFPLAGEPLVVDAASRRIKRNKCTVEEPAMRTPHQESGYALLVMSVCGLLQAGGLVSRCQGIEPSPDAKIVRPEAAAEHVGETCTIEMQVRSSRRGDNPICFLNSELDFSDRQNFTVVIIDEGLARFKKAGIDEPAKHFEGKKIRVTGKVEKYRGRPQIRADDPKQIEIVKQPAGASAATKQ